LAALTKAQNEVHWVQTASFPRYQAVYAFVVDGQIKYVGATTNLARRMAGYRRRQIAESLTRPVHHEIKRIIDSGNTVYVFAREITLGASIMTASDLTSCSALRPD